MAKVPLTEIISLYDLTSLNNNFTSIENAFENNVLFRKKVDTSANTLEDNVDANGKRIYNLPTPILPSEAARLQDVQNAISGATAANLISITPVPNMASTNVQAALEVLTTEVFSSPAVATKLKIVAMGDSLTAQNGLLGAAWPEILERNLNALNIPCEMYNLALNALDFYSANTSLRFGSNTPVQQIIALAPDIVITTMGLKDVVVSPTRTLAEVQADATTYYNTIKAALPNVKLVHMAQRPYDAAYFTPATLLNKGTVPNWFKLKSAGILSGAYCSEMLDDPVDAATVTAFTNLNTFYATIAALGSLDTFAYLEYWKIARLGGVGNDNVHMKEHGSLLQAGYVQKALTSASYAATLFPNKSAQSTSYWNDPDTFFTDFLTATGSGNYTTNVSTLFAEPQTLQYGPEREFTPDTWYFPYHTKFSTAPLTGGFDPLLISTYTARGATPNQVVYNSLNGAAFNTAGISTDSSGYFSLSAPISALNFAPGAYTLRYKVGNEVYGPYTLTVSANTMPYVHAIRTANQTAAAGAYTTISFNSETTDRAGEWNVGSSTFTASRTGIYHITASAWMDTISANSAMVTVLFKNGTQVIDGSGGAYTSTFLIMGSEVSGTLLLAIGDTIQAKVYYSGTGSPNIIPGSATSSTRFQATYIRP